MCFLFSQKKEKRVRGKPVCWSAYVRSFVRALLKSLREGTVRSNILILIDIFFSSRVRVVDDFFRFAWFCFVLRAASGV